MLTIIHHLVLSNLVLVALENRLQRVGHPSDNALTAGVKLGQLVGLLDKGIEGSDFEGGYGVGGGRAILGTDGRGQGLHGFVLIAAVEGPQGEGEEDVAGHGCSALPHVVAPETWREACRSLRGRQVSERQTSGAIGSYVS